MKKSFCLKAVVLVYCEDESVLPNIVLKNMKHLVENSRISGNMKVSQFTKRSLYFKFQI
jgi:hypothetical protein